MDSFPPYRAVVEGVPSVVYSLEDDKKIVIAFEEREYMYKELFSCETNIDSMTHVTELYIQTLDLNHTLLESKEKQIAAAFWQIQLLQNKVDIGNELNRSIQQDYNKLQQKSNRVKKRNNVLFTVGGILLTGLVTGLIVKLVL